MTTLTDNETTERTSRYRGLIPLAHLPSVSIIGCGAVGRQVALTLAHMNLASRFYLFDPDTVEEANCGTQGWEEDDIGGNKAMMLGAGIQDTNPFYNLGERVQSMEQEWTREQAGEPDVVFMCVDSIDTRRRIFGEHPRTWRFWCDGRMSAESGRILSLDCPWRTPDGLLIAGPRYDERKENAYTSTFFNSTDAYEGPCTARSTFYCAAILANLMVSQMTKWMRGRPVLPDLTLNIPADDLFPTPGENSHGSS